VEKLILLKMEKFRNKKKEKQYKTLENLKKKEKEKKSRIKNKYIISYDDSNDDVYFFDNDFEEKELKEKEKKKIEKEIDDEFEFLDESCSAEDFSENLDPDMNHSKLTEIAKSTMKIHNVKLIPVLHDLVCIYMYVCLCVCTYVYVCIFCFFFKIIYLFNYLLF
jgi:hypothetical protein